MARFTVDLSAKIDAIAKGATKLGCFCPRASQLLLTKFPPTNEA
jgi:hypothetical protein